MLHSQSIYEVATRIRQIKMELDGGNPDPLAEEIDSGAINGTFTPEELSLAVKVVESLVADDDQARLLQLARDQEHREWEVAHHIYPGSDCEEWL